ncbi:hypothetical protein PISMIDRAFT_422614 [Pisolithus microcarpus 441]|uniref:Uncharacterized protein n=1 Tax=Pisolithus microcarpus 441 TaxID=765257 RepID=A0A0C9ZWQ5_9AGAM|nr:hypothetical protein PISMIDRAFT_422614 [Pisolithus microcarpus 441]
MHCKVVIQKLPLGGGSHDRVWITASSELEQRTTLLSSHSSPDFPIWSPGQYFHQNSHALPRNVPRRISPSFTCYAIIKCAGGNGLTHGIGSFHAFLPSDTFIPASFVCAQCGDLIDDPLSVTTHDCRTLDRLGRRESNGASTH